MIKMVKCKKCKKEIVEYWEKTTKLCLDCVRERETDEFGRSARYG